jgi:gluconolactonase
VSPGGICEPFGGGTLARKIAVPNWGAFDGLGNYYVSDSGTWGAHDGLVWVVRPGGRTEVWTEATAGYPNGLAVDPDNSRLYIVESMPARVVEVPIDDAGRAGRCRVLVQLGLDVPDGVAVTADGSLVISCYRPDAIYRWSAGEGLDVIAHDPQGILLAAPTNVAFGGDGLEVLVAANLGGQHLTRGRIKGLTGAPLFRPSAVQLEGDG